jgi:gentisate 1,2-dioxygenase
MAHTPPVLPAADGLQDDAALQALYRDFDTGGLAPLRTEIGDSMPVHPSPAARPHVWRWRTVLPLAQRAGDLVPAGRGGERRAMLPSAALTRAAWLAGRASQPPALGPWL